ncbi:MAG: hypothetical protein R3D44_08725 [Hyphomicrobiaceae bacterium]
MLHPRLISHRMIEIWIVIALAMISSTAARAQVVPAPGPEGLVRRGDAVVTGFAATRPPGPDLPLDIHPLDRTTIDPESATVRIFDLTQLGGGPEGQLSDAPVRHVIKAKDVGHVFGIAFDGDGTEGSGPPNLYLTATSVHGLQLMAPGTDGNLERVMTGRPGAQWMSGLFGGARGGGPGSIWKVDGRTGEITLFADIKTGDLENSGAGLGAIAFDPRSRHFYVSDMETGLIWRLDLTGKLIDTFDHGTEGRAAAGLDFVAYDPAMRTDRSEETFNTEEPETWGFAPPTRRVWGLAVENNRLYYAIADGPTIWSVGLAPDGSFAGDARVEIQVKGTPAGDQISTILFDGPKRMHLAQRGSQLGSYDYQTFMRPQESAALRYLWDDKENRWTPAAEEYSVGLPPDYHGAVGGLALNYGYDRFGKIDYDRCRQTLWLTGEHLRAGSDIVRVSRGGPRLVGGLQGIYKNRVRPDNEPPFEAWYVDYDATYSDEEKYGHIGNVGIFSPCKSSVTYSAERVEIPVWTKGANLVVEKRCEPVAFGGRVRCVIVVRNTGDAAGDGLIQIVDETRTLWGPAKGDLIPVAEAKPDGDEWVCSADAKGAFACKLPAALLAPGGTRELSVWIDTRDLVLGGNVGFRNCVTIDHPAGKGRACSEGGTGVVVSKTGPAFCKPGTDCTFTLTVTNASPQPFKGDVLFADHMVADGALVDAAITKIEPPLACAAAPTKLPFSCLAPIELAAGESLAHKITITMPPAGPAFVQNCFAATDPWLFDHPDLLGGLLAPAKFQKIAKVAADAHPACLWIKLGEPKKVSSPAKGGPSPTLAGSFTPTLGLLPPSPVCANGRPPLPGGRCACPLNAPWDPETESCNWRPVCWDKARLTPSGQCCPRGTVWWASTGACRVPPVIGCRDASRRKPDGGCCARGERWRDGACRPRIVTEPCGIGFTRLLDGRCIPLPVIPPIVSLPKCPDGRDRLRNGRCPHVACPLNAPFNPRTGRCQPTSGPGCGPGFQRLAHSGRCVPVGGGCPGRLTRDGRGRCVPPNLGGGHDGRPCGYGQKRINGRCIGVSLPPPKPGSTVGCPGRLVRDGGGKCVPPKLGGIGHRKPDKPRVDDPPKPPRTKPDDDRKSKRDRIRERAQERDKARERQQSREGSRTRERAQERKERVRERAQERRERHRARPPERQRERVIRRDPPRRSRPLRGARTPERSRGPSNRRFSPPRIERRNFGGGGGPRLGGGGFGRRR